MRYISVILIAAVLTGCQLNDEKPAPAPAVADFRYKVFEVPLSVVDEVIPLENQKQIADSTYLSAIATPKDFADLLDGIMSDSGLLWDRSRTISWWPKVACSWAYSRADGNLLGGGTGGCFLGVRAKNGVREIRVEYYVTHTINTREAIQCKTTYEGPAPADGVLITMRPFERLDGTALVYVVAFEIKNWR